MDRPHRASAQGARSPVATMPSPTVIRTARMSAPERVSFADLAVEGGILDSLPQPPPRFPFASSPATRSSDATGLSSPAATSEARRSTRKRKAPELLEPSPEPDHRPRKRKAEPKKPPPSSLKRAPARLKKDPDEPSCDCCICMTEPEPEELATIDGCEHYFCFGCIEKWADRENTCPLCKTRFGRIERVHKPKRQKGVKTPKSSLKVKDKSQRMELTSSLALEGLFGELGRSGIAFESFFARLGSSRFNTHIARIVVGGPPGSGIGAMRSAAASDATSSASAGPSTRSSSRNSYTRASSESAARASSSARSFANVMFGDEDDESDEDDDGFSGFVNSIRSMDRIRSGSFSFSGMPFPPSPPSRRPPRSFATNSDQVNAGGSAETPLEIADSDNEDDEVVVVGSRRAASRSASYLAARMSSSTRSTQRAAALNGGSATNSARRTRAPRIGVDATAVAPRVASRSATSPTPRTRAPRISGATPLPASHFASRSATSPTSRDSGSRLGARRTPVGLMSTSGGRARRNTRDFPPPSP